MTKDSKVIPFSKATGPEKIIKEARGIIEETYGHIDRAGGLDLSTLPAPRGPYDGQERMMQGDKISVRFYDGFSAKGRHPF